MHGIFGLIIIGVAILLVIAAVTYWPLTLTALAIWLIVIVRRGARSRTRARDAATDATLSEERRRQATEEAARRAADPLVQRQRRLEEQQEQIRRREARAAQAELRLRLEEASARGRDICLRCLTDSPKRCNAGHCLYCAGQCYCGNCLGCFGGSTSGCTVCD